MDKAKCPDRTAQYLTSLQTGYREDLIELTFNSTGGITWFIPFNPMRVMLVISQQLPSTNTDFYFRTGTGLIVYYATLVNQSLFLTQQLHFLLPTYEWGMIGFNGAVYSGVGIVKQ